MSILLLSIVFFILTLLFTGYMRHYALKKNIIDNPNDRSSHTIPTPRGGGVAVVCSYLLALGILIYNQHLSTNTGLTLMAAGFVIALLGFLDDHGHINSMLRLGVHFLVAIGVVVCLDGFEEITVFNGIQLGFIGNIIAVMFLVWLLNLYNFMDGINGIASVEAITATVSMAIIYFIVDTSINSDILWLLAACVFGFLLWNFPNAKIFMGDSCSGFLGLILGILALIALKQDLTFFYAWIICLGVFIVDATYTLIKRIFSGYKIYDAHRSHGYQILSRKFGSHTYMTLIVAVVNLIWLFPVAYITVKLPTTYPEIYVLIAYLPLILLAIKFKAGNPNA